MHGRIAFVVGVAFLAIAAVAADGDDARYSSPLAWKKERFSRVLALGYTDLGANGRGVTEIRSLGGESCLVGPTVGFDVDDGYAFDIDERGRSHAQLRARAHHRAGHRRAVRQERRRRPRRGGRSCRSASGLAPRATIALERARLAGQGAQGVDVAITGRQGVDRTLRHHHRAERHDAHAGRVRPSATRGQGRRRPAARCRLASACTTRPAACRCRRTRPFPSAASPTRSAASG